MPEHPSKIVIKAEASDPRYDRRTARRTQYPRRLLELTCPQGTVYLSTREEDVSTTPFDVVACKALTVEEGPDLTPWVCVERWPGTPWKTTVEYVNLARSLRFVPAP